MTEEDDIRPIVREEELPEHENDAGNVEVPQIEVKVYLKRWYILAVFSVLGILQGMIWNSLGPVSESVLAVFCPYWTESTMALFGNWGNIMYIIPVVPVLWFFEVKGLRASMLLTSGMMLLGTLLRCLPLGITPFTWMCHLCAILNGIAGIVVFSAPSAVSSAWFPPNERTTATGIAIVFNNLGNAFSFFAAPAIVPDPTNHNDTTNYLLLQRNNNDSCPYIDEKEKSFIQHRVDILMYFEAAIVGACFLTILFHFPSKPKCPPSLTSSMQRMDFLPGLKKICLNKKAVLMTLSFSLFNGVIASWYSVMNITFRPLPIGNPEDTDRIIGYIGIWSIVGNCVTSILVSRIVDSLKGKMKLTLFIIMTCGVACWIWLGLLCLGIIPFTLAQLYISTILASSLTYSSGPIFFEFCVEIVYPVPEGIVGGFLTCIYNTFGMIFLFLFYIPAIANNPHWIPYAIMVSTASSLPLLFLVKEEYNRSQIDSAWQQS